MLARPRSGSGTVPRVEIASRTAQMVAAFRGRATGRTSPICCDPWALTLAGDRGAIDADRYERAVPAIELWIALRTARIDEATRRAITMGVTQVVILGAGFDTRAARLAHPGVRWFEVDAPPSQAEKLRRLATLEGYPTDAATYVPCDFESESFFEKLERAGFDAALPAIFVWEGVSYYLTEAAVRATLSALASRAHPDSVVVFDFFGAEFAAGATKDDVGSAAREQVADMGEPLRFGTNDVLPFLVENGFRKVHVESFDEIALRYTGTYERSRGFRFQALAFTSVARSLP